jgi:hypothetical protein
MASSYVSRKDLTLGQQVFRMRTKYPRFVPQMRRGAVSWSGSLKPTEMSADYRIRICYKLGTRPEVSVLEPQLRGSSDGKPIPHIFPGNYLCLYQPRYREWLPTMFIADTIIPWAALWLYYYEVWHATGDWLGGGEHPVVRERKDKRAK